MDFAEIKKVLDEQGAAFEAFKQANDELIKAKADGKAVADLEAKVAAANEHLSKLDELKANIQSQIDDLAKRTRPGAGSEGKSDIAEEVKSFNDQRAAQSNQKVAPVGEDEYVAYKSAFLRVMRFGERVLSSDEQKAMQVGVESEGGYFVPAATVGRIIKRVYEQSMMRQLSTVMSISTNDIEGLIDRDEADYGWVGEHSARTETNTPEIGKWRLECHEMYAAPKVTQKLLDDSAVDIESWLANKVADKYARAENDAFINGNGAGKPRGLFTYTTAATGDATRAWGTFEHVVTGANGDFHTTKADPLFDFLATFKNQYLQNARWLTRREVIAKVRKIKEGTSDNYIWQPGLQMGQPDRLLGFPIVIDQDVPALGSGSLSMALGDFAEAYTILDRIGIRTLRDPYTAKPYVIFYSTRRIGGGALNFDAVKFVKFST